MMSNFVLKPVQREFNGYFVNLDIERIKTNIKSIINCQEQYFSDSLDTLYYSIITKDGRYSNTIGIYSFNDLFQYINDSTVQLRIDFYNKEKSRTRHYGFPKQPEEYIKIAIDFARKQIYFSASVIGAENSEALFKLATSDITIISKELPIEHQYLEIFHNFHQDHPLIGRNIFLINRFQQQEPFPTIVESIRNTCAKYDLNVLRADDREYIDDLWDNVLTYMYGCKYAIAVFDHINYREFNPNVALEVGFLLAQCKSVLLLKDLAITAMPTDIIGKIYRSFNTYDPINTIPPQIEKWIIDYKIGILEK